MVVLYLLQLNDENLTHLQLIGMARGVASGMAYLSAMNFIHRVMKIFCLKYVELIWSNYVIRDFPDTDLLLYMIAVKPNPLEDYR